MPGIKENALVKAEITAGDFVPPPLPSDVSVIASILLLFPFPL